MKTTNYLCNLCKLSVNGLLSNVKPKEGEQKEETAVQKHGVKLTCEGDRLIMDFVPEEETDIHICSRCLEKLKYTKNN